MAVLVLNASEVDRLQTINTELAPVGWVNELALFVDGSSPYPPRQYVDQNNRHWLTTWIIGRETTL